MSKEPTREEMLAYFDYILDKDFRWVERAELYPHKKENVQKAIRALISQSPALTREQVRKFVEGSLCKAMDFEAMMDAVQCFLRADLGFHIDSEDET